MKKKYKSQLQRFKNHKLLHFNLKHNIDKRLVDHKIILVLKINTIEQIKKFDCSRYSQDKEIFIIIDNKINLNKTENQNLLSSSFLFDNSE